VYYVQSRVSIDTQSSQPAPPLQHSLTFIDALLPHEADLELLLQRHAVQGANLRERRLEQVGALHMQD
jgi:hypothetical protein